MPFAPLAGGGRRLQSTALGAPWPKSVFDLVGAFAADPVNVVIEAMFTPVVATGRTCIARSSLAGPRRSLKPASHRSNHTRHDAPSETSANAV